MISGMLRTARLGAARRRAFPSGGRAAQPSRSRQPRRAGRRSAITVFSAGRSQRLPVTGCADEKSLSFARTRLASLRSVPAGPVTAAECALPRRQMLAVDHWSRPSPAWPGAAVRSAKIRRRALTASCRGKLRWHHQRGPGRWKRPGAARHRVAVSSRGFRWSSSVAAPGYQLDVIHLKNPNVCAYLSRCGTASAAPFDRGDHFSAQQRTGRCWSCAAKSPAWPSRPLFVRTNEPRHDRDASAARCTAFGEPRAGDRTVRPCQAAHLQTRQQAVV